MNLKIKFLLLLSFFLVSCDKQEDSKSSIKMTDETLLEPAWLRTSLPQDTIAYLRLPNPWYPLSSKENGFEQALGNQAHLELSKKLRQDAYENFIKKLTQDSAVFSELIFNKINAPLEFALFNAKNNTASTVLIMATKLNFSSIEEFKSLMNKILPSSDIKLVEFNDGNAEGKLEIAKRITKFNNNAEAIFKFDINTKKFTLLVGDNSNYANLQASFAEIKTTNSDLINSTEEKIDSSSQGLFFWASPKKVTLHLSNSAGPAAAIAMQLSGLSQADSVAFGYGVSDKKSRLKYIVEMPDVGVKKLLPVINNQLKITTVGKPSFFALVALPDKAEFKKVFTNISMFNNKIISDMAKLNKVMKQHSGIILEDVFDIVGSEVAYYSDEIGDFFAINVKQKEKLYEVINQLAQKQQVVYQKLNQKNIEIHHLSYNYSFFSDELKIKNDLANLVFSSWRDHYYWIEEDGYFIFSGIPQPLIERASKKQRVSVSKWLQESQGHDLSHSFIAATGSFRKMPRTSYHAYLYLLQILGSFSGGIDMMDLPTAGQLNLPEEGSFGFSWDMHRDYLSVEVNFQNGMTDMAGVMSGLANSYMTIAGIGILSAIALPAYQDYKLRSDVAEVVGQLSALKPQLAEALVAGVETDQIQSGKHGIAEAGGFYSVLTESVSVENAEISVQFKYLPDKPGISEKYILLTPYLNQNKNIVEWKCESDLSEKYLPNCR